MSSTSARAGLSSPLGSNLLPILRDTEGKTRADLPAPAKRDDARKAARAVEDWKSLKKTLRDTLHVQSRRLEHMLHGRRWLPQEIVGIQFVRGKTSYGWEKDPGDV